MGENAKKIGDKLEGFGEKLYERFGWAELTRDTEIKCLKSSHKTEKGSSKKTHGIDLYHKYLDIYKSQYIGVITECKNYGWESINTSNIQKWVNQLLGTIECSQISQELKEYNEKCDSVNTGILLVHCNDGKYDEVKFREYVSNLTYKSRRSPINIFVASNREIERWDSMFNYIETTFENNENEFKFYYPSVMGSDLETLKHVNLYQLYSSYIFGENKRQAKEIISGRELWGTNVEKVIFCFDVISESSIRYLSDMFKELQLEGADRYIFCFYPQSVEDVKMIDEKVEGWLSESLKKEKIKIVKLDNRRLSPVDTK